MKKYSVVCSVAAFLFLTGCVSYHEVSERPLSQLEVREMQSREFDTKDVKLVMKSMMNVLQDEGFIIKNAVLDLGLLSAEKNMDIEDRHEAARAVFFEGPNARWEKELVLEASANVSEYGNKTRVRMNFQFKKSDNRGLPLTTKTVNDPAYYQTFFEKVSKGVFIQQENI